MGLSLVVDSGRICRRYLHFHRPLALVRTIVTSAINAPAPVVPTMGGFDRQIKDYAYDRTTWKGRITQLGDCKILLGIAWLIVVLVFFVIFQGMAPLFRT